MKKQTKNKILELIEEQENILSKLRRKEPSLTPLNLNYDGFLIHNVKKASVLVEIEASIFAREAAYTSVLKKRGLEDTVVGWSQSNLNIMDWEKVLDKAFDNLINQTKIALVKDIIKLLKKHLTEETKLKTTLEKLLQSAKTKLQ